MPHCVQPAARSLGTAFTALLVSLALPSCSKPDTRVASIDHQGQASSSQIVLARALVECLITADVPAVIVELEAENGDVVPDTAGPFQISYGKHYFTRSYGEDFTEQSSFQIDEVYSAMELKYLDSTGWPSQPTLFVGSDDKSDVLASCIAQTAFREPDYDSIREYVDPVEELEKKQNLAEAGARWASCARQNGFPSVSDPAPVVADYDATYPVVRLPLEITENQLTALLKVCPNFDPVAQDAYYDALATTGEGRPDSPDNPVWPMIEVSLPSGYDPAALDNPITIRVAALESILGAAQDAYYSAANADATD